MRVSTGLQALVRSLADLEQLHGIRVTCLMPGVVKTPLWTDNPEKLRIVRQEGEGGGHLGDTRGGRAGHAELCQGQRDIGYH